MLLYLHSLPLLEYLGLQCDYINRAVLVEYEYYSFLFLLDQWSHCSVVVKIISFIICTPQFKNYVATLFFKVEL